MDSALERLRSKSKGIDLIQKTSVNENPPIALPGFDHINRFWDKNSSLFGARILPGEYYVTKKNEYIITVLGSCISACIWDDVAGIGGMNHFMLPDDAVSPAGSWKSSSNCASARYGNVAMEQMINDILKNGGNRSRLQVKIFGGGQMLKMMTDIGQRNIMFIEDYIRTEGLRKVGEDVGDVFPRKVMFFPINGRVKLKRLKGVDNALAVKRDNDYIRKVKSQPKSGDIELF